MPCYAPNCRCITPCDTPNVCQCGEEAIEGETRCRDCEVEEQLDALERSLDEIGSHAYSIRRRKRVVRPCRVCDDWTPFRLTAFGDVIESVDLCGWHLAEISHDHAWTAR